MDKGKLIVSELESIKIGTLPALKDFIGHHFEITTQHVDHPLVPVEHIDFFTSPVINNDENVFNFGLIEHNPEQFAALFSKHYDPNIEATFEFKDKDPLKYQLIKQRERLVKKIIRDKRFARPVTYYKTVTDLKFKRK